MAPLQSGTRGSCSGRAKFVRIKVVHRLLPNRRLFRGWLRALLRYQTLEEVHRVVSVVADEIPAPS
jgi:hypothetical protein